MKVFAAYSQADRHLIESMRDELERDGISFLHPFDSDVKGDSIFSTVSASIHRADLILAVLGDHSENVVFEIGFAVGIEKPVVLAAHSFTRLPSNLLTLPYVRLTGDMRIDRQAVAKQIRMISDKVKASAKEVDFSAENISLRESRRLEFLSPLEFEKKIAKWFHDRGAKVSVFEGAYDRGYDLEVEFGTPPKRWLVEAKKVGSPGRVSMSAVDRLASVVKAVGADGGLLISSSPFTSSAVRFAAITSDIKLLSLDDLLRITSIDRLKTLLDAP